MLYIHLIAIAFWGGIIAVEIVLELFARRRPEYFELIAQIHYIVDLWIELPTILVVMVSGIAMLEWSYLSGWFLVKIMGAMLAIIANLACVFFVIKRKQALALGQSAKAQNYKRIIDITPLVGVPGALMAFIIGMLRLSAF